ncbi:uncharacterized protein MELLADRAFT_66120 [Melampsora larici-populina 98AG31]|uniref:Uncharacterized protein n=1 Tax=Melampsora larici-populina (strain 98AG31 / pathotype 3-4-7) TaxID=747676 RepID=F4RXY5_MELLP|nr:uncharacterized protein MELLADRAFT_66120 [Melampsora larici-populina 98AG31]EGG02814.1 hypothetical protein MELLADRAFT_66120 [Melampsora larici-populina 98AG31]
MASNAQVPCDCPHTCKKDGREFCYIARRTRIRHQELTAQLGMQAEDERPEYTSTTSINQEIVSQAPSPIEISNLLLNYNTHLLSKLSIHNEADDTKDSDLMDLKQALMVCTALLHSTAVSRTKIGHIIKFLNNIIKYTVDLSGRKDDWKERFVLPLDIRSITNHLGLEPVLFQTICCPGCYSQYSITDPIRICLQKETPRAKRCDTNLRGVKDKPIQMYSTQSLIAWISKLLQHPGIETALELCVSHVSPNDGQYIPASKKVAGFGSHSANFPCAYCYIPKTSLHDVDIHKYKKRTKEGHREESQEWKKAGTKKLKNELFSKNSVRWAGLNDLEYWDPTKMIILDLMHNLAGIIEYHIRELMELEEPLLISRVQKAKKDLRGDRELLEVRQREKKTQRHQDNLKDELDGLGAEAEEFDIILDIEAIEMEGEDIDMILIENKNNLVSTLANEDIIIPDATIDDGTSSDLSFHPEEEAGTVSSDDSIVDDDYESRSEDSLTIGSDELENAKEALQRLKNFQKAMTEVVVPAWIARPPYNFGNPAHGKLKFDTWFKIFQIFLPLVAADVWDPKTSPAEFENLQDLVAMTRLLTSKKQSTKHSDALRHFIPKYVKGIQDIYQHCEVKPNHHYSLHYPDIIDYSGPSASLTAWAGERVNHQLAKVRTNKQMATMSTTMIKQVVRHHNLCLLLKTSSRMKPGLLKSTFEALLPFASDTDFISKEVKEAPHRQKKLDHDLYLIFYDMCCTLDRYKWQDAGQFPLDLATPVLSPQATPHISLAWNGKRVSTFKHHEGNSLVQIYSPLYKKIFFGSIYIIFTHTRSDNLRIQTESYVGINIFPELSVRDSSYSPYLSHTFAKANIHLRYEKYSSNSLICRLTDIRSHIAIHRKAPGTYGISEGTVAIVTLEDITAL